MAPAARLLALAVVALVVACRARGPRRDLLPLGVVSCLRRLEAHGEGGALLSLRPLVPPDLKRCQALFREGSFMTLGPRQWRQCKNEPVVIATEKEPSADGRRGSMSLCRECCDAMSKLHGPDFATLVAIEAPKEGARMEKTTQARRIVRLSEEWRREVDAALDATKGRRRGSDIRKGMSLSVRLLRFRHEQLYAAGVAAEALLAKLAKSRSTQEGMGATLNALRHALGLS